MIDDFELYSPLPRAVKAPLYPVPLRWPSSRRADVDPAVLLAAVFRVSPAEVRLTASGTAALRLALASVRRADLDEVIVPTFACPNVAQAVLDEGMRPALCDVGTDLRLNPVTIERALTSRTVGVVAVRPFGLVPDVSTFCGERGLVLFDDAAQALPEPSVGGYATILSFGPQKPLPIGRGGALIGLSGQVQPRALTEARPSALRDTARRVAARTVRQYWSRGPSVLGLAPTLRTHVPEAIETVDYTAPVEGMDATSARLLARALGASDDAYRTEHISSFLEVLAGKRSCQPLTDARETLRHGYLPLVCASRVKVAARLAARGLETSWLYYPLHRTKRYGAYARGRQLLVGDRLWRELLLVPCRPWLRGRVRDRVLMALQDLP